MMPDSRDARQKVKIAMAALVALDLSALVVMFSPLVGSERSRRDRRFLQEPPAGAGFGYLRGNGKTGGAKRG